MSYTHRLVAFLANASFLATAAGSSLTCYDATGNEDNTSTICDPTASVSVCCRWTDTCLSNGLCRPLSTGGADFYFDGCTDSTFNSSECAPIKACKRGTFVHETLLGGSHADSILIWLGSITVQGALAGNGITDCGTGSYCCFGFNGCDCNDPAQVFTLPAGTIVASLPVSSAYAAWLSTATTSVTLSATTSVTLSTTTSEGTVSITRTWITTASSSIVPSVTGSTTSATSTATSTSLPKPQKHNHTALGIGVGLGGAAVLMAVITTWFCLRRKRKRAFEAAKPWQKISGRPYAGEGKVGVTSGAVELMTGEAHGVHELPGVQQEAVQLDSLSKHPAQLDSTEILRQELSAETR